MSDLKKVRIHSSLVERPLPFFGAGTQVGVVCAAIVFLAQVSFGLFSWHCLGSILLCYLIVKSAQRWREVDPFGLEAFMIGAYTPKKFVAGTHLMNDPVPPPDCQPSIEGY